MKHSNLDVPTILVSQIEIDKLVYVVVDNKKGYIINVFLHWCYDGVCTLLLVQKKIRHTSNNMIILILDTHIFIFGIMDFR